MSVGHLKYEKKTKSESYLVLGEADTSALYARPFRVDTSRDIPYGGGVSVDGRTVYIDHTLYGEVMCRGPRHLWVVVTGMSGKQVIACWVDHEHTEWSVEAGDNPIDVYAGCHGVATYKEEEGAGRVVGADKVARYEAQIEPGLRRCLERCVNKIRLGTFNPPKDLWCGPVLDDPSPKDMILIRGLKAKGVADAFKASKGASDIMYRIAGRKCHDCKHYHDPKKALSICELVSGAIRDNRQCEKWEERK